MFRYNHLKKCRSCGYTCDGRTRHDAPYFDGGACPECQGHLLPLNSSQVKARNAARIAVVMIVLAFAGILIHASIR